ncbi:hypothetical protein FRC00_006552, partial [Tulasnella sp. 408]
MKSLLSSLAVLAASLSSISAQIAIGGECGGPRYQGSNLCEDGAYCALVTDANQDHRNVDTLDTLPYRHRNLHDDPPRSHSHQYNVSSWYHYDYFGQNSHCDSVLLQHHPDHIHDPDDDVDKDVNYHYADHHANNTDHADHADHADPYPNSNHHHHRNHDHDHAALPKSSARVPCWQELYVQGC